MSPGNLAKFKDKLAHFNWSAVYSNQDPKCVFDLFYNYYLDLYGTCFPIMGIQSLYHTRKSWLTQGLRKSIKTKNLLQLKSKAKPCLKSLYTTYKNNLTTLLRKTEKNTIRNSLPLIRATSKYHGTSLRLS